MEKALLEIMREAWHTVEIFYREEQINSERCLQAVLYHALRTSNLPKTHTILVEPTFGDRWVPDIVIRDAHMVKCIMELKCTPHWWVNGLRQDLSKLIEYSTQQGSMVRLEVFGPDHVFDTKTKEWVPPMPKFAITPETWYVFAVLTRHDDRAARLKSLVEYLPAVGKLSRFCLLAGVMYPEAPKVDDRCKFMVQPIEELQK